MQQIRKRKETTPKASLLVVENEEAIEKEEDKDHHHALKSSTKHSIFSPNPIPFECTSKSYLFSMWLFLRLMGVIYFIAYLSMYLQIDGLLGKNGILPAEAHYNKLKQTYGENIWAKAPSVLWLINEYTHDLDRSMHIVCIAGMALSFFTAIIASNFFLQFGLWFGYFSMVQVGQTFYSFQWDILLLEAGFLTIFIAPFYFYRKEGPSRSFMFLIKWLSFRLMFSSGIVKLNSTWTDLTAMNFHYYTQPLPPFTAWYLHNLPDWFHKLEVVLVFVVEIFVVCLIWRGRKFRITAALIQVFLQIIIILSGNYNFFNWLAIVLFLPCLDDAFLLKWCFTRKLSTYFLSQYYPSNAKPKNALASFLLVLKGCLFFLISIFIFGATLLPFSRLISHQSLPEPITTLHSYTAPYHIANNYGLFAHMTTKRIEIDIQGSDDGVHWKSYAFKYKPGDVYGTPFFVSPYSPRLDWQMWFEALNNNKNSPWFINFVAKLLEGSDEVLALLSHNAFPTSAPKYIQAVKYDYKFTSWESSKCVNKNNEKIEKGKGACGAWWKRKLIDGPHLSAVTLENESLKNFREQNGWLKKSKSK